MARSSADRPVHLVSLPGLLLMLAVILVVLYLLIPKRAVFENPDLLSHPDPLSIAYLRAVLRSDPDRHQIRLALVRELLRLGDYHQAAEILAGLPEHPPRLRIAKALLEAGIELRKLQARPQDPEVEAERQHLLRKLKRLQLECMTPAQLQRLLIVAQQLGARPAFLAWVSRAMARLTPSLSRRERAKEGILGTFSTLEMPASASHWWAEAGRWSLAANEPAQAALDYQAAALAAPDQQQAVELANLALDAALMANQPEQALKLARDFLSRWQDDGLLRRGVALALAVSRHDLALAWNGRYLQHHPGDLDALRDQRETALAIGDLKQALPPARTIAGAAGATRKDHERLAQILEWQGQPRQALAAWQRLAVQEADERAYRQIVRLARMTGDLAGETAALRQLARLHPLQEAETWRLAGLYEAQGLPEAADEILDQYLRHHPGNRRFWRKRLQLALDLSRMNQALNVMAQEMKALGVSDGLLREKARILWLANREAEAWEVLRSQHRPLDDVTPKQLLLYGELAWRAGDLQRAMAAYRRFLPLLRRGAWPSEAQDDLETGFSRLITLAEVLGDSALAMEVAREGWQRWHKPTMLLQAMRAAARHEQWAELESLARMALKDPQARSVAVLLLVTLADGRKKQQRWQETEHLYHLALQLDPQSTDARLGLLWLYIDRQRSQPLQKALMAWQPDALENPRYWGAYAAGWEQLQRPRQALPWVQRQLRRTPDDPLWLFNFADLLEQLSRRADAWRIRRHALSLLEPRFAQVLAKAGPDDERTRQAALALQRMLGPARLQPGVTHAVLEGHLDTIFLIGWELAQERDDRVRYWLARQHLRRLQLPAWQRLGLAMAENDQPRIDSILEHASLSPLDRARAEERLGRWNLALSHALPLVAPDTGDEVRRAATQWSAILYQRLPTDFDLSLGGDTIGELETQRQAAGGRFSRRDLSLRLSLVQERLDMPRDIYDLNGRDREVRLRGGIEWWRPADRVSADIGLGRRDDLTLPYLQLGWVHRLTERNRFHLSLMLNGNSDASQIVRADTALDRLQLAWQSDFTPRTWLFLALDHHRLHSRHGGRVAEGERAEFSLGDRQMLGTNELDLRLQGSWLKNRLADTIPEDMAERMPPGSSVADILDDRYASLGIGLALGRGDPMTRAPTVGGLRYLLDGWIGWEWPGNRPASALVGTLGSRVLGSDELALHLYYNSSTLNFASDQSSWGWTLQYRYFIGR